MLPTTLVPSAGELTHAVGPDTVTVGVELGADDEGLVEGLDKGLVEGLDEGPVEELDEGPDEEGAGNVGDVDGVSIITVVAGPVSPLLVYGPVSVVDVVVNVPVQGIVVVVMIPGAVDEGELWGEELDGTDELDGPELLGV